MIWAKDDSINPVTSNINLRAQHQELYNTIYPHFFNKTYEMTITSEVGTISVPYKIINVQENLPSVSFQRYVNILDKQSGDALTNYFYEQTNQILTLSFNTKGGTELTEQEYLEGESLEIPTITKDGYTFDGWYLDYACNSEFTGVTMPAQSITIYAKWSEVVTEEPEDPVVEDPTIEGPTNPESPEDPIEEEFAEVIDQEVLQPLVALLKSLPNSMWLGTAVISVGAGVFIYRKK
jgi:uncharacterized repeat protein (TIGR02543 family)